MKKLVLMFLSMFIVSALLTQAVLYIGDAAGIMMIRRSPIPSLIYLTLMLISGAAALIRLRIPPYPAIKLRRILISEGYSPVYYSMILRWQKKCEKRHAGAAATLLLSEALIDGGHYSRGFKELGRLDPNVLDLNQKQVYYNTCLYGAVMCGDRELAERIYKSAGVWLNGVTSPQLSSSVKHTLGCYEYLRGNKVRAEELFIQSLDSATSYDVICEDKLALAACYLDTDRLTAAREVTAEAAAYAQTKPLREKLERTKKLIKAIPHNHCAVLP